MESLNNNIGRNIGSIGKVLVALIAAMAMLLTGVNLTPAASAAETVYNPDAPASEITSGVTVDVYTDENHTRKYDPDTDKAAVGQTFYGSINFDFSKEESPTLDSPNRSYTFPKNINVKDKESSTLYDKNDEPAGTWQIKDGVVTAHWNKDWLTKHPSDISAYVSFDFTLGDDAGANGDKERISFPGGGGDIDITLDKSQVGGQKDYKVNDDGTITFTIVLKPQFAVQNMVVTDTMGSDFTFVNDSFQLDGKSVNATVNGQKAEIALGDLSKADEGGHQLTYTARLTGDAKKTLAQGGKLGDAKNTAQWQWDGADKPGEADVTPDLGYNMVQKSDGEGNPSDIKWTVQLNSGSYKAPMAGYVFKDTLNGAQRYTGSYTVKDANGDQIATGNIDGKTGSFEYTFPDNATSQQYTIEYHTKLDDTASTATVTNNAEVAPPNGEYPKGSDDGSFTPRDTTGHVTKRLVSGPTGTDGRAEWSSTIKTSTMPTNTDPSTLKFWDGLGAPKDGDLEYHFDGEPVFTIGDRTLTKGKDYEYTEWDNHLHFDVTFKDSDAIRNAFGRNNITVTYATVCNMKTYGTYKNTATLSINKLESNAVATYDIEKTNLVDKTGSMTWNPDFEWSTIDPNDTTKGAWVAKWQVDVNKDDNSGIGKKDTHGNPIVVKDTLPQGMSYVPGSGDYTVNAGDNPGWKPGKLGDVMTAADGELTFTIPTDEVKQQDGSDKAYAKLTYSTVAKGTGDGVSFTNTATADTGSIHLGDGEYTVTGDHKVIDKSAVKIDSLNHVQYTIKVNPEGRDLVQGADTITLSDVMDPKGVFIPSTFTVTNSDTGAKLSVPVKVENVTDADGNPTTKLTLTLPDSTPVTVTYDVKPNGKPTDKVNLKNTATLEGVAEGAADDNNDWIVTKPTAGSVGAAGTIAITKTDANDLSLKLAGAKFTLYKVNMNKLSGTKVPFEQVQAAAQQVGDEVPTKTDGVATFGSENKPLEINTLYYFVETVAPTGTDGTAYEPDPTPHYFMLPGTNDDESAAALKKANDFGLHVSDSTSFYVYDKRKPTPVKGSVTLYKQLTGRAWKDSDAFTFQLSPDTGNSTGVNEDALKAAMPEKDAATATAKNPGGADGSSTSFKFGDFTFPEAGTYAYTVKETSQGGDGVTVDNRAATVTFTVEQDTSGALTIKNGKPTVTGVDENNGKPTFTNTYTPGPVTVQLHAQKKLTGREWKTDGTDHFDFKLEAVSGTLTADKSSVAKNDVPMPAGAQDGVLTHTATNGDVFGFGQMTYTKAGTYVYNISEVQPSAADAIPGVSYSADLYRATVTVTDDGTGKLTAKTAMELAPNATKQGKAVKADPDTGDPVATITNTYAKLSQNWSPKVYKSYTDLSGGANPLTAGKFQFTLTPVDGAPLHVVDASGKVTEATSLTADNDINSEAAFQSVQFTDADLGANRAPKTYSYQIAEVKGSEAGMSYDHTVYTAAVTVFMNGTGQLTVTPVFTDKNGKPVAADKINAGRPVFTNTYAPTKADVQLKASKTLEGAALKDGQFSFQLYDGKQSGDGDQTKLLQTKTNAENGDVKFDTISLDKVGTYDYSIREVVPADAVNDVKDGITYDGTWKHVQVKVTLDKQNGKLQASDPATVTFKNGYDANGAAALTAKKEFKNADGSSRPIPADKFSFQLHEVTTTAGKVLQTKPAAADGSVTFDSIAYKLSDLDGKTSKTFTYTVNEVTPAGNAKLPGVTYDTASHTYKVTVRNAGDGTLATTVTADGKVDTPTFTNTYDAAGQTAIAGVKKVTGDDGSDQTAHFANAFTFTLTGKDKAPIHVDGTGSDTGKLVDKTKLTASNTAAGTVSFGTLHYTLADLADVTPAADGTRSKTFTYEVAEDAKTVAGVTNDATATRDFTVTVKDDGSGKLDVTTAPADATATDLFAFTNTYAASATLTLTGTKTMTGRKLTANDRYTFDVYEGTDATGTPVATGTSDATGKITFDKALSYTLKDLGDHTYTVVESETNLPGGVTAVTRTHTFTVNVADTDHNGTLKLTTSGLDGKNGGSGLAFENNYTTTDSTPIEFKGVKLLDSGDYDTTLAQLKGRFTFTLTGKSGAPLHVLGADGKTATDETEVTATNDDAGNVDFGRMVYHFADLGGKTDRTFTYTVTESGDVAGVTNDADLTREFTVTLHDNGDGTMSATTDPATGALFSFENTYSGGVMTDAFDFTKTLDGRALDKGEFTFTLTGATGADGAVAPMPEGAKDGVKTVTNAADGKITFGRITYDKPGTYAYTVREAAGDLGGVTYDDTVYTVTVTVKDNHDGTMTATHAITRTTQSAGSTANGSDAADDTVASTPVKDEDAVFANTYAPAPTAFTFTATKTIKGRDLKDGEFTFELRDADGKTIQTAKNSADGKIAFTPITFDKAGEYTYTIRESKGDATGVTYDTTVYTAKVTVTDNLDGTMTATVAYQSGLFGRDHKEPAFENTYTPPLSTTGAGVAMPALIALLLLGGGAAILVAERRRRDVAGTGTANGRHRR